VGGKDTQNMHLIKINCTFGTGIIVKKNSTAAPKVNVEPRFSVKVYKR
jgi:hypothetical protein